MTIHFVCDITRVGRISDSPRGLGGRRLRFNFNTFLYDYENAPARWRLATWNLEEQVRCQAYCRTGNRNREAVQGGPQNGQKIGPRAGPFGTTWHKSAPYI